MHCAVVLHVCGICTALLLMLRLQAGLCCGQRPRQCPCMIPSVTGDAKKHAFCLQSVVVEQAKAALQAQHDLVSGRADMTACIRQVWHISTHVLTVPMTFKPGTSTWAHWEEAHAVDLTLAA